MPFVIEIVLLLGGLALLAISRQRAATLERLAAIPGLTDATGDDPGPFLAEGVIEVLEPDHQLPESDQPYVYYWRLPTREEEDEVLEVYPFLLRTPGETLLVQPHEKDEFDAVPVENYGEGTGELVLEQGHPVVVVGVLEPGSDPRLLKAGGERLQVLQGTRQEVLERVRNQIETARSWGIRSLVLCLVLAPVIWASYHYGAIVFGVD